MAEEVRPDKHLKLIQSEGRPKSCLRNVFLCDANLIISRGQVKGSKVFHTRNTVKQVINPGKRVPILNRNLVQVQR
jgi:hypothetical protein